MLIYLITFIVVILFTYWADNSFKRNKFIFLLFSAVVVLLPSLVAGFRDETVGTDMNFYMLEVYENSKYYTDLSSALDDEVFEPVFLFLVYVAHMIWGNLFGVLFLINFVCILSVYVGLCLLRKQLDMWIAIAFFMFLFYNDSLNLMRQYVSIGFCFLSFAFLYRRYYIPCIIAFLFAFFSHKTSFVFVAPLLIFEYLCRTKHPMKFENLSFIVLPIILLLYDVLLNTFISIGLLSDKYSHYMSAEADNRRFPVAIVFFLVLFFIYTNYISSLKRKNGKTITEVNIRVFAVIMGYCSVITSLMNMITMNASRMSILFQIFYIFTGSYILSRFSLKNKWMYSSIFISLVFFYWLWRFIIAGDGDTYPYTSKILGIH